MRALSFAPTFPAWQEAARRALRAGWPPGEVAWQPRESQAELAWAEEAPPEEPARAAVRVPPAFPPMAARVACHRDAGRWALLYRVLWRLTHGERELLEIAVDPDVRRLDALDGAVRREIHKMRAFVRFRKVARGDGDWYAAWFEPAHDVVEANAPFFAGRFAGMRWSILTPDRCAHWDGTVLSFTPGAVRGDAPAGDAVERLWLEYYSHIFNPARVKTGAMRAEMPQRYWKNLPEAAAIGGLVREAPARVEAMRERALREKSQNRSVSDDGAE